jgi:hypothetical protein
MAYLIAKRNDASYDGTMLRLVIDTDVLLSAFISSAGASRQLVLDALDGKFAPLLSTPLLVEYESVLRRPQHLARAQATEAEVTEILDALAGICVRSSSTISGGRPAPTAMTSWSSRRRSMGARTRSQRSI